jgi:hypothetical protein
MAFTPKLSLVVAASVLAMGGTGSSAADLPEVTAMSLQVKPLTATSAAGRTLFLQVHWEGPGTVGKDTPVSVAGAPEGTILEVSPLTAQDAVVGLAFSASATRGHYVLSLGVGSPELLVTQQIEVEIGE